MVSTGRDDPNQGSFTCVKAKLKWLLWAVPVVFILLQFTNPARTNPPVKNDLITAAHPPAGVAASLRAACYDCHSHETVWPWYAHVAPGSWLVTSDVNGGRRHVDFSEWPTNPVVAVRQLGYVYEVLAHHEMPPLQYTLMHSAARLTAAQHQQLLDWLNTEALKQMATATTNTAHSR